MICLEIKIRSVYNNTIMDNEIWKDINGYEGIYQVSNFGNIKRLMVCQQTISDIKNNKTWKHIER